MLSPDCDKASKPLKFTMMVILIFTILAIVLIVAGMLYNYYGTVEATKPAEVEAKKKWINMGLYLSVFTSLVTLGAVIYAIPNVNKVISCPAQVG